MWPGHNSRTLKMCQVLWVFSTIILSIGGLHTVASSAGSVNNVKSSMFWWDILQENDEMIRLSDLVDMSLQTLSLSSNSDFWKQSSMVTTTTTVPSESCNQFYSTLPGQHRDDMVSLGQMMAKYWVIERHRQNQQAGQIEAKTSRRLGRPEEQRGSVDDRIHIESVLPESFVVCSNRIGPRVTSDLSSEEDGYLCFLDMAEGIIGSLDTRQSETEMSASLLRNTNADNTSKSFILATPLLGNATNDVSLSQGIWLTTYDGLLTASRQEKRIGVSNAPWYFILFQLTELIDSQGNLLLSSLPKKRPHRQQQQKQTQQQQQRLREKSRNQDEEGMDMGNDFCNGMSMIMAMKGFQFSVLGRKKADCITYFVSPWKLSDSGKFVGAMMYSFLLAIMTEALTSAQQRIKRHLSPGPTRKWVMSVLYGIQQLLGYVVMFIAMTYSIELFLAAIVGLMIGNAFYPHSKRHGDDDDDEINDNNRPMTPQRRRAQAAARQRQIGVSGSDCGCDDLLAFSNNTDDEHETSPLLDGIAAASAEANASALRRRR